MKERNKTRIFPVIELNKIKDLVTGDWYSMADLLGGGAGGVEEAPVDGESYVRKGALWTPVVVPTVLKGGCRIRVENDFTCTGEKQVAPAFFREWGYTEYGDSMGLTWDGQFWCNETGVDIVCSIQLDVTGGCTYPDDYEAYCTVMVGTDTTNESAGGEVLRNRVIGTYNKAFAVTTVIPYITIPTGSKIYTINRGTADTVYGGFDYDEGSLSGSNYKAPASMLYLTYV